MGIAMMNLNIYLKNFKPDLTAKTVHVMIWENLKIIVAEIIFRSVFF